MNLIFRETKNEQLLLCDRCTAANIAEDSDDSSVHLQLSPRVLQKTGKHYENEMVQTRVHAAVGDLPPLAVPINRK